MKAILEFQLPEEESDYELCIKAKNLHCAIWEYAEWIRGICKHGDASHFDANECREKLYALLSEYDYAL